MARGFLAGLVLGALVAAVLVVVAVLNMTPERRMAPEQVASGAPVAADAVAAPEHDRASAPSPVSGGTPEVGASDGSVTGRVAAPQADAMQAAGPTAIASPPASAMAAVAPREPGMDTAASPVAVPQTPEDAAVATRDAGNAGPDEAPEATPPAALPVDRAPPLPVLAAASLPEVSLKGETAALRPVDAKPVQRSAAGTPADDSQQAPQIAVSRQLPQMALAAPVVEADVPAPVLPATASVPASARRGDPSPSDMTGPVLRNASGTTTAETDTRLAEASLLPAVPGAAPAAPAPGPAPSGVPATMTASGAPVALAAPAATAQPAAPQTADTDTGTVQASPDAPAAAPDAAALLPPVEGPPAPGSTAAGTGPVLALVLRLADPDAKPAAEPQVAGTVATAAEAAPAPAATPEPAYPDWARSVAVPAGRLSATAVPATREVVPEVPQSPGRGSMAGMALALRGLTGTGPVLLSSPPRDVSAELDLLGLIAGSKRGLLAMPAEGRILAAARAAKVRAEPVYPVTADSAGLDRALARATLDGGAVVVLEDSPAVRSMVADWLAQHPVTLVTASTALAAMTEHAKAAAAG